MVTAGLSRSSAVVTRGRLPRPRPSPFLKPVSHDAGSKRPAPRTAPVIKLSAGFDVRQFAGV
ncbi:MAG: hypothetical protein BJ554DRAFT_1634 [Olpidium bornovanus]|uniref:Uncharacterized protein n=1 Tax=Olpidium bornovanus TaxID=278681 RepID=A0A8H7ZS40_9FUNG|nr:MAG: hypothetical protein BJ554DRAFT_1634 [Olpidium bornovanus]